MPARGSYRDRRWCTGRCRRPAEEDHDAAHYLAGAVGDPDRRDAPGGADRAARSRPEAVTATGTAGPDAGAAGTMTEPPAAPAYPAPLPPHRPEGYLAGRRQATARLPRSLPPGPRA